MIVFVGMVRSISIPDDLDARVEAARGDVPRSVFWVRAMEKALDGGESMDGRVTPAPVATTPPAARQAAAPPRSPRGTPSPSLARFKK